MSTRKLIQAVQQLSQQFGRLARSIPKNAIGWLLRGLLRLARPQFGRAGFVLPTTILLLLVVSLTVGSIALRTYNRTAQAAGERQQRVVYNAATPAIDRAKAKLEFLFDVNRDPRYPGGIPRENQLLGMMLNPEGASEIEIQTLRVSTYFPDGQDPYTFPDETRIDLSSSPETRYSGFDNAWTFRADTDGNGEADATIAYSILFQTPQKADQTLDFNQLQNSSPAALGDRATKLQVRNGPLSNASQTGSTCPTASANSAEGGWIADPNTSDTTIRKNFQVDAFVLPDNSANTAVSTLEFFQDRKVNRGNKWGAWFRNDLEIFPGPNFNWNGAMHTEGSLIVGKPLVNGALSSGKTTSYLISAPSSCLYSKSSSEVTFGIYDAQDVAGGSNDDEVYYGHAMSGTVRENNFDGSSIFHLYEEGGKPKTELNDLANVTLTKDTDSVNNNPPDPAGYTLDPVALLTQGISKTRDPRPQNEDPQWQQRADSFVKKGRIYAQHEEPPYVDDSYRADNRYGPKPQYKGEAIAGKLGDPIPATGENEVLIRDNPPQDAEGEVGLDGYWERRARSQGLRLIVGQRLELGNAFGWNFGIPQAGLQTNEPLRPWLGCNSVNTGICNQARQRRSLYDNLAAVQATAVYHANGSNNNKDFPLACLATTVHPGTAYTLERSATFEDLRYDLDPAGGSFQAAQLGAQAGKPINGDFFSGRGTNGWEYEAPSLANLQTPGSPVRGALRNLAMFAGDPRGGSPSFFKPQTLTDGRVHPFPSMAMWGDFSILRNVLDLLDAGGGGAAAYNALSPADKTTLHTAACTLGMLAYNVNYLLAYQPNAAALTELQTLIRALYTRTAVSGLPQSPAIAPTGSPPVSPFNFSNATPSEPEDVIAGLEAWRDISGNTAQFDRLNRAVYTAQMLATKEQVYSDLAYGFSGNGGSNRGSYPENSNCAAWLADDPLAQLCSKIPHYPVLYSIFPSFNPVTGELAPTDHGDVNQATRDEEDAFGSNGAYVALVNGTGTNVYTGIASTELASIAVAPKLRTSWLLPTATYAGTATTPNGGISGTESNVLIRECTATCIDALYAGLTPPAASNLTRVAFKDSAFMNGRELMGVRALDMDLGLMRTSVQGLNNDFWLPKSGIIYAFREDAVGESSIVRPAGSSWSACSSNTALQTTPSCRMNTGTNDSTITAYLSTDPPLNDSNLITPKPVDYYADPDRRPNGFRLRNGIDISRTGEKGMTLVSDNPVYIQGDFNWHRSGANGSGSDLEEFKTLVAYNNDGSISNFYDRTGADVRFASPTQDYWRPAEILADAVTILSKNFCDGSLQDGIITATAGLPTNRVPDPALPARYGCEGVANSPLITSYFNQGRPNTPVTPQPGAANNAWHRANKAESLYYRAGETGRSPIRLNRFGNPIKVQPTNAVGTEYNGSYVGLTVDKPRDIAAPTRVNATIVSGIVPSRPNQSYGGLHNFPRFIETWETAAGIGNQVPLRIAGSFIQLNFSNYATAPFDQDAFEVGASATPDELINYYKAPARYWGYDVGLQYAPAGPLAQRFITLDRQRSEFYSEPPADDPYLLNLCNKIPGSAGRCPNP